MLETKQKWTSGWCESNRSNADMITTITANFFNPLNVYGDQFDPQNTIVGFSKEGSIGEDKMFAFMENMSFLF